MKYYPLLTESIYTVDKQATKDFHSRTSPIEVSLDARKAIYCMLKDGY